jgi:hypothetical protein
MSNEIEEFMIRLNQDSTFGVGKTLLSYNPKNKSIRKKYENLKGILLEGHEPYHVISYASFILPEGAFLNYNIQNITIGDRSAILRNVRSIIIYRKIQEIHKDFELWLASIKMKTLLLTIMSSIFLATMSKLPFLLLSKLNEYQANWFNIVPFIYGFLCIILAYFSSNIYSDRRFTVLIVSISSISYVIMLMVINIVFNI